MPNWNGELAKIKCQAVYVWLSSNQMVHYSDVMCQNEHRMGNDSILVAKWQIFRHYLSSRKSCKPVPYWNELNELVLSSLVFTHAHTHTHIHTHRDRQTHIHTNKYIYTWTHTYIYTYIHTYMSCIHTIHTYILTYIHTHIHTYKHYYMCMRARVCVCTQLSLDRLTSMRRLLMNANTLTVISICLNCLTFRVPDF